MTRRDGPFLVFGGIDYYPSGGMNDYLGAYPTLEQAKAACQFAQWADVVVYADGDLHVVAGGQRDSVDDPWQWTEVGGG